MAKVKVSKAFAAALKKKQKQFKKSRKAKPGQFSIPAIDNGTYVALISMQMKMVGSDKKLQAYFKWTVARGAFKGVSYNKTVWLDDEDKERDQGNWDELSKCLQVLGYEMDDIDVSDLLVIADEVTKEKPLIKIGGRTMLGRVVEALRDTGIDEIFIAVTDATPRTKRKAKELKLRIVQTPGKGYVKDIKYLMKKFKEFLVVSADLPFLSSTLVRNILTRYRENQQPISVVVPKEDYEKMGFIPSTIINNFVPIGVNIVANGEDYLYITKGRGTININTQKELEAITK